MEIYTLIYTIVYIILFMQCFGTKDIALIGKFNVIKFIGFICIL